jgi:hypothetical protein
LPQVFGGHIVALGPLIFESRTLSGELLGDALDHICDETVSLFYGCLGSSTKES